MPEWLLRIPLLPANENFLHLGRKSFSFHNEMQSVAVAALAGVVGNEPIPVLPRCSGSLHLASGRSIAIAVVTRKGRYAMAAPELNREEPGIGSRPIDSEGSFLRRLLQECRRAERSRRPILVVLFHSESVDALVGAFDKIHPATRETDIWGWYRRDRTLGVVFTELESSGIEPARTAILNRVRAMLPHPAYLTASPGIGIASYILPVNLNGDAVSDEDLEFCDELGTIVTGPRRLQSACKRLLDVAGSAVLLLALSPLMLAIAISIRLSSPGPVFFLQSRTGFGGRPFTLLKFRSMHVSSDTSIHEKYVKQFIHGTAEPQQGEDGRRVYKLTHDARVTRLGGFLRRTSLDELPQLLNVFYGDMSLVGPRPPIPYEVACYELWHQRRVLEAKPGITGLWQVRGRSLSSFDEMVRLDLNYAAKRSLGLDFRILLETPRTVFGRSGAH